MKHATLHILALAAALAGCAAPQSFRDGNALLDQGHYEQGLAILEQTTRAHPGNAEYRIAYLGRKAQVVDALNARAAQLRAQGRPADAAAAASQVLALDPANPVARQTLDTIAQQERAAQQPKEEAGPRTGKLAAAYRKPVTLAFRDAPLRSVFDFIGKVSGLNFVFDRDVDPALRATISVRDTSIEEAIAMLLSANRLEQAVTSERSITIYPNTPEKVKDYQQLVVRSFYLANADVKTVSFSIKTLLKAKDVVTDDRLGIIMMRDTPEMIRMAERIIAMQDMADPEVMLDVEVLEVKRSRLMELGIRWPEKASLTLANPSGALSPLTVADLHGIHRGRINLGIDSVILNAQKTDTDSNILANPRIRVRNKEKAKVLIGDRVPVITVTTNNGVSSDSVNYVDVGLKLDVEPNITPDDEVAIKVNLEVSNVVKDIVSKSGTLAYQIGTRSASTVLRLKDGETQVLAGLISDEDRRSANKVPGIGELPILNRLFGSQKGDSSRSEIVLSITPRLIRQARRPDLQVAQFESGTEGNIGGRGPGPAAAAGAAAQEAPPGLSAPEPAPVPAAAPSGMTGASPPPLQTPPDAGSEQKGPGGEAPRKVIR